MRGLSRTGGHAITVNVTDNDLVMDDTHLWYPVTLVRRIHAKNRGHADCHPSR
jgi:hypothetical protein